LYALGMTNDKEKARIVNRFRGYLPVVVDIETGGFVAETDALLEIAACIIEMDDQGRLRPGELVSTHVTPFPGANIEPISLELTGIDPEHPFRGAIEEKQALQKICLPVRKALRQTGCQRAILVGHNPAFDLSFLGAAIKRTSFKRSPFHPFSTFDTATLGGLAYGQTVLARAVKASGAQWDQKEAHSAIYDTQQTAGLFCRIVNLWGETVGMPVPDC
jgi:ribonuclease T